MVPCAKVGDKLGGNGTSTDRHVETTRRARAHDGRHGDLDGTRERVPRDFVHQDVKKQRSGKALEK